MKQKKQVKNKQAIHCTSAIYTSPDSAWGGGIGSFVEGAGTGPEVVGGAAAAVVEEEELAAAAAVVEPALATAAGGSYWADAVTPSRSGMEDN